nr:immunoglobulin heavy chain junction region [Macaca mulatta]MOW32251.1 immunoglobulin heavy chain junction region [Macaca mulatta]MOW32280.1 immunoglobulin heavy chain junction region [Macaca mulatta]MOW32401.1 immunoglobulin heavy chain junction region [Macaca mulatta]MOW32736.1 immunoglobulin heavy chain junction region [Macaca mulatta]
CTGRRGSDDYW